MRSNSHSDNNDGRRVKGHRGLEKPLGSFRTRELLWHVHVPGYPGGSSWAREASRGARIAALVTAVDKGGPLMLPRPAGGQARGSPATEDEWRAERARPQG